MAESLAGLLHRFRSAARLSQEALAERAGLSTRTVSDIETGSAKTPRLVTLLLLAEALSLGDAERARLQEAVRKPARRVDARDGTTTALPPPRTLLGRDAAAAAAGDLLVCADVRLVTLYGPAGVGKTSLALQIASNQLDSFPDGAVFAELAPVLDPAQVAALIARVLGIRDGGQIAANDAIVDRLRNRTMLLVLDNLEHLTPIAAWLAELLAACPNLTVLATSREVLHVKAEHVFAVKPLDAAAAMDLFVERARAVQPDFAATGANRAAITTIVQRLEGLPLAIELAAPQLRLLSPKGLAARLERRLPMLDRGALDLPARQRTMRDAIAWSYDLLSAGEQVLFRRVCVFRGGGSLGAARAVAGDRSQDDRAFLLQIAALAEKSVLSLEEDVDGEPRIATLEMLREFGLERLGDAERDDARARHAAYFLEFAEAGHAELKRSEQALWLSRFEREHPNSLAALTWYADRAEIEGGLRLAFALSRFWWLRGHLTEGQTWLTRFLAPGEESSRISTRLRARGLRALVVLMSAMGDFARALGPCEEAVSLQRDIGDDEGLAASLNSLGIIMQFRDDLARSKATHEESLAIRRRIGDEPGIASSLSNLASVAYSHENLDDAARLAGESLTIYRRLGHASGMGHALTKLGLIATQHKDYELAQRLFEECLALQRRVGNDGSTLYSLSNLGMVAHKRGEFSLALDRQREALDLLHAVPNKPAIAATLEGLAASLGAAGEPQRAARILGAADSLRREIGSPLLPRERADYDETVAATRNALGQARFDTEWWMGAIMGVESALDEARATATGLDRTGESV